MHLRNSWPALDVDLRHPALAVGVARRRRERRQLLGLLVVERDVGDQVADHREGAHRRDRDGLVLLEVREPAHAHQPRLAVDLGAARAALAGLAVPPDGEVAGLGGLHAVDRVEHDLALGDLDGVVLDLAAVLVAAPDPQLQRVAHAKYFFSSSGITGNGFSCRSTPVPSALRLTTRFLVPHSGFGPGEVVAGVTAARLLAGQRRLGDALADDQHVAQVEGQVPAGVVLPVPLDVHRPRPHLERLDLGSATARARRRCG